jgi:hypothetical protein
MNELKLIKSVFHKMQLFPLFLHLGVFQLSLNHVFTLIAIAAVLFHAYYCVVPCWLRWFALRFTVGCCKPFVWCFFWNWTLPLLHL